MSQIGCNSDIKWDICVHFHGMSDFGFKDGTTREYSRPHTYTGECYALQEQKIKCVRNGNCVIAKNPNWTKVNKSSW